MKSGLFEEGFDEFEGLGGRLRLVEKGVGDGGEGLAKFDGLAEDFGGSGLRFHLGGIAVGGEAVELAGLAFGEEAGLAGEAEEVFVGGEAFFGSGEAVVEGVDEVEGGVAGDELEGFEFGFGIVGHEDITS